MSRPLLCDSCGLSDAPEVKASRVLGVRLVIGTEKALPGQELYEGDLCGTCTGLLLHGYFRVKAEGGLEIPAFLNGGGG